MIAIAEACRLTNAWLAWLPCLLISARIIATWDAPYVRPDVRRHYRAVITCLAMAMGAIWLTALQYERSAADVGPVSILNTALMLAAIWMWHRWPSAEHPRPLPPHWVNDQETP